jgi:NAD(P)-dependent dehydrogenase (short-subunit alcohol dehydrogenase family)
MEGELAGKVALIIGGGGAGIGGSAARIMAREGASVVVADLDPDRAGAVAADITGAGRRAHPVATPVDAADDEAVAAAVATAVEHFGNLHVAVQHAAAPAPGDDITTMDLADWDRAYAVNVRGAVLLARHAIPHLRAAGGGSMVFTAAAAGLAAEPTRPEYGSSKAALQHLTRYLASRYGPDGIRCNAVAPGMTIPLAARSGPMGHYLQLAKHHVLGRIGEPDELGEVIAFLASDRASFVTGVVLPVDGGMTCHAPYYADIMSGAL